MPDTRFRADRWTRAGANPTQIEALAQEHAALTVEEQAAEAARIDGISDLDLAQELAAHVGQDEANVGQVLEHVGTDKRRARTALRRELAREDGGRSTLIEPLRALLGEDDA